MGVFNITKDKDGYRSVDMNTGEVSKKAYKTKELLLKKLTEKKETKKPKTK